MSVARTEIEANLAESKPLTILDETAKIKRIVDEATCLAHYDMAMRMVWLLAKKYRLNRTEMNPYITALQDYILEKRPD